MNHTFVVSLVLSSMVLSGTATPAPPKSAKQPKSGGSSCGSHCRTERWPVKTLTDSGGAAVAQATPTDATVTALTSKKAPTRLPQDVRVAPTEKQQFKVKALLIAWKEEATGGKPDHDFHLVLADPQDHSNQMIAEVPSPDCESACASKSVEAFRAARSVPTTELGPAPQVETAVPVVPPRVVEVTGVGFFDFDHKQDGLAANCIEIHPVLKISFQGKEGSSAIPFVRGNASATCGKPSNPRVGGG